jgi:hypothetical protein
LKLNPASEHDLTKILYRVEKKTKERKRYLTSAIDPTFISFMMYFCNGIDLNFKRLILHYLLLNGIYFYKED